MVRMVNMQKPACRKLAVVANQRQGQARACVSLKHTTAPAQHYNSANNCSKRRIRTLAAASATASSVDLPDSWANPPKGFFVYETMIIYNPDLSDVNRDAEIKAVEDFLEEQGALDVAVSQANTPQRMAYPIEGYNVGIYVLLMYCAPSSAAKTIQQKLSAPSIEKEKTLLRFMTTRA